MVPASGRVASHIRRAAPVVLRGFELGADPVRHHRKSFPFAHRFSPVRSGKTSRSNAPNALPRTSAGWLSMQPRQPTNATPERPDLT